MNRKVVHALIYLGICITFPALPLRGIGLIFKCLGAFFGGMLAEVPVPFNPFK